MEQFYSSKVVAVGTSRGFAIPADIANGLGWQRGDRVVFLFADDDRLIIKKFTDEQIRQIKRSGEPDGLATIEIQ